MAATASNVIIEMNEIWRQSRGSIDDDIESMIMDPLSLADISRRGAQRDSDGDSGQEDAFEKHKDSKIFSIAMGIKNPKVPSPKNSRVRTFSTKANWLKAAAKAKAMGDPWEQFHWDTYPVENAKRYRYNALKKQWVEDLVVVKMEPVPFNKGAMRECFRMKKLSNFCKQQGWGKECNNYVAKKYMEAVDRKVYFEDVKLQMDAKLWGEEFNRHNPPKKVDIIQMCVVEMIDRPDRPVFHLEHYIEGEYVKYNSNSGFVVMGDDCRKTPQAFSHFTFERSGHELLVVDIQGVGDLYTDPQIHTVAGTEYGDGNLGTRGMALFFHSHVCNTICVKLGLSQFDLALPERAELSPIQDSMRKSSATRVRGDMERCRSPSNYERTHWIEFLQQRARSGSGSYSSLSRRPKSSMAGRTRYVSECAFDYSQSESRRCVPSRSHEAIAEQTGESEDKENRAKTSIFRCYSQPQPRNFHVGHGHVGRRLSTSDKARHVSGDSVFRSSRSSVSGGSFDEEEDDEAFVARQVKHGLNFEDLDDEEEEDIARAARARGVSFCKGPHDSGCHMSTSTSSFRRTSGNGPSASESSGRFTDRRRLDSECSTTTSSERDRLEFRNLLARKARKTDVLAEKMRRLEGEGSCGSEEEFGGGDGRWKKDSVLGQIHLDLAKYHELGRFSPEGAEDEYDHEAALFHLRHAADLGILEAVVAMAHIHLGLPHDILSDISRDGDSEDDLKIGFRYLMDAAELGDRNSSIRVAKALDTGIGLPPGREVDWKAAAGWYEKLMLSNEDAGEDDEGVCGNGGGVEADPPYAIKARLAEMLMAGGKGLEADPNRAGDLFYEAAEEAAAAMKGRLANKYYMKAEEAYALAPAAEE